MLFPIRDRNPSNKTPWVVFGLIAANALVFLLETSMARATLQEWMMRYGFVAANATETLRSGTNVVGSILVPLFTSMFIHGGWLHLIFNLWFLYIFGDNVEARLGHVGFLPFYFVCGLLATLVHYALAPNAPMPTIGASGAIAGVLGAYIVCWPRARVLVLVPIFYFLHFMELPALAVLGMWFVLQLFGGLASLGVSYAHGGVAYGAHIGGFLAGMLLVKLWPAKEDSRPSSSESRGRRRP